MEFLILEDNGETLRSIRNRASVTSLTIPATVRRIHAEAFEACSSLVSIELPEGLEVIGQDSFRSCISLTSMIIPTTVRRIDYGAFKRCSSLASIELPIGLKQVGTRIFGRDGYEGSGPKSIRLSISPTRYYELLCKDDIPEHDENRDLVLRGSWSKQRLRVFQAAHALVYKSLPLKYWAMFLARCSSEPDAIFYFLSRNNAPIQTRSE